MAKTIVLSAGHGGSDPGAVYNGVRESDANLAITLACRDYLNRYHEEHRLVLPRTTDVYVSLPARRELTRAAKADLYVSMHNNAYKDEAACGFSTYLHSGPLFDVTVGYRDIIHRVVYDYVKTLGVRDRGKKRADHWVTREMPAPTVLMEYMFVSNRAEGKLLKDQYILKGLGEATGKAIAAALKLPAKGNTEPVQPPASNHGDFENLPLIKRRVGIAEEGRMTAEKGFLIDGETYTRAAWKPAVEDYTVIGHGDYIDFVKRVKK